MNENFGKIKRKKCFQLLSIKHVTAETPVLLSCLPTNKRQGHVTQLHSIIHPANAAKKTTKKAEEGKRKEEERENKAGRNCGD